MESGFVVAALTAAGSPLRRIYRCRWITPRQNIGEMTRVTYTFNIPQRSRLWIWLAWLKYDDCDTERLGLYWIFNLGVDFGLRDMPFLLLGVVGTGARKQFGTSLHWIIVVQRLVFKLNWDIEVIISGSTRGCCSFYFALGRPVDPKCQIWDSTEQFSYVTSLQVKLVAKVVAWQMTLLVCSLLVAAHKPTRPLSQVVLGPCPILISQLLTSDGNRSVERNSL